MYELAAVCGEPRIDRLRERLTGPELAGWINFLNQKQRQMDKTEYYLAKLILEVAAICGEELEVEDVLINWDAASEPERTATLPPLSLALALARNLGAVIIDNRENDHGKNGTSGNACCITDCER